MKRAFLLLFFCTVFFIITTAQSSVPGAYKINSDTAAYISLPVSTWQIMADSSGDATFNDVLQAGHFQDTDRIIDYKVHVYWLRFRIVNNMSSKAAIALPENAARADLYTQLNSDGWNHSVTGTMVHWSDRSGLKRVPAFTLTIPPGGTLIVYKRVYWNYVAAQPDSMSMGFAPVNKIIQQDYIQNDAVFMTSIQDAFILGLFILSMIISFYFFLVVREKEFLYFSVYLLIASLQSIPSLGDAFLREYPKFLLYLYIFANSFMPFMLIHFLRRFLKIRKRFPLWDIFLVIFSFLLAATLLATHFASSLFQINLAANSHFFFNLSGMVSGIIVLITLFLYARERDKAIRLMIIALTPILFLKVFVYTLYVIFKLYSQGFGEPTLHGYVLPFSRMGFIILILCFLWMMAFFNWVLFLRFSNIRKKLSQQSMLDQLKSRFFANISHEFRTPLTLILGPLEDFKQHNDTNELIHFAPEMHRNSKRLLKLINQLLDLSKLDTHHYHLHADKEGIIYFVKQIVHSFSSLAHRKDIELETEIDPRLKEELSNNTLHFYFDEDIIEKVLTNLLSNAFKFTENGRSITVSLSLTEKAKNSIELRVEDTGLGIEKEKLPYIFDRFYQTDDSNIRKYEGTGIGLALVKELVELHHGSISATSMPGIGTTISCFFPLNEKLEDKEPSEAEKAETHQPPATVEEEIQADAMMDSGESDEETSSGDNLPIVLIVEDQPDMRKYISNKLENRYHIMEAKDGKDGLDMALDEIPDLVISDVMMPVMDGFELCKALKTDRRTSHIPVIILTARADDSDKIAGLETGADAYLIKPFNARELRLRVKNLIEIRNKLRAKFSQKMVIKPRELPVNSIDKQFIEDVLSTIENHLGDWDFSVTMLSKEMYMSISQLNRKLKAIINQTSQQFIRSIRMERALELLKNNAGSIGEISNRVGFEDPGYFTQVFKKYFGFLPSEKEKYPS